MKKPLLLSGLLFFLFTGAVNAQGTTANTAKSNPPANHPALSSPAVKPPVAKKEPRRAKTSSPEMELKHVKQ
jgi:hypothetical protein